MKTFKEFLTEAIKGRIIPTHLKSGKPNPDHPLYDKHLAAYTSPTKVPRAPRIPTQKPHEKVTDVHFAMGLGDDTYPHDQVGVLAKKLRIDPEDAQKGLDKHAKKNKYKDFDDAWSSGRKEE